MVFAVSLDTTEQVLQRVLDLRAAAFGGTGGAFAHVRVERHVLDVSLRQVVLVVRLKNTEPV